VFGALRNRNFLLIWLDQLVSSLGDYFYWLAMPLSILQLTGSTVAMGSAMIALSLPALVLGPLAGTLVDRWDRRLVMIGSNVGRGLVVLLCLLVRSPEQVWIFYVVGILQSAFAQFFFPARNAAVPLVVKEEELTAANGLLQVTMTFALIAGAGLAGVTIQLYGLTIAFFANSLGFGVAATILLFARVPRTTHLSAAARSHPYRALIAEMREGLSYILASRTLIGLLACNLVLMIGIGALNVVWVPFMQRVFGVGPAGLGLVDGAQGVGMGIGSLAVGFLALRFRKVTLIAGGLIWVGLMIVGIGVAPTFAVVVGLAWALGLALPPLSAGLMTITQLVVPDLKRGRVGGIMNSLTTVGQILAMAGAGFAGESVGLRWIYGASGVVVAISGAVSLLAIEEPKGMVVEQQPVGVAVGPEA
jgi:MFS transporter, DHA3 family, macrolide efflux protein